MLKLFSVLFCQSHASERQDMTQHESDAARDAARDTALIEAGADSRNTNIADEDTIQTTRDMLIRLQEKHVEIESQSRVIRGEIAKRQAQLALLIQEHGLAEDVSQQDHRQSPIVPNSVERAPQSTYAKFLPINKANLRVTRESVNETSESGTVDLGPITRVISNAQLIEINSRHREKKQRRQRTIGVAGPRQNHVLTRQTKRRMSLSLEPLNVPVGRVGYTPEPQSEYLQGEKDGVSLESQRSQLRSSESPRKRRQLRKQTTAEADEDEAYTSNDSLTGDPTYSTDWRICQIKTAYAAADQSVRQYWHWVGQKEVLEHQVLQRVAHITGWRAYRPP